MASGVFSLALVASGGEARSFIAGPENALLPLLPRALSEPTSTYLPLCIWGLSGVGKSYLAEGLVETWRAQHATAKIQITDGVEFARRLADAVDTDSVEDFRQHFRAADLVWCDQVHLLSEKPFAAREFCALVDHLSSHEKPLLCTSLTSPLSWSDGALSSRLTGGLTLPLEPPSFPTQTEMLATLVVERGLIADASLQLDLLERLNCIHAKLVTPRILHAAITQLLSLSALTRAPITASLIASAFPLPEIVEKLDLKRIFTHVARKFGITLAELRSSTRRQSLVQARGVAALFGREFGQESYQNIGKMLGNRDHSTIHHAVEKMQASLASDAKFASFVQEIRNDFCQWKQGTVPQVDLGNLVGSLSPEVTIPAFSDTPVGRLF